MSKDGDNDFIGGGVTPFQVKEVITNVTTKDIDDKDSIRTVFGKQLENIFNMINSTGLLNGEVYDGFLLEENPITTFKNFRFFLGGSEQFSIPVGFNSDNHIGAIKTPVSATVSRLFFVQGLNLGNEAIGSTMGVLFVVGGANAVFTIIQDLSGKFGLQNNNTVINLALVPEGVYQLVIRVDTDGNDPFVDQITIVILATALISNINLSNLSIEAAAPIGQSVGALTTTGGEAPITFTILSQLEGANAIDGDPVVDIFELAIDGTTIITKAAVGNVGDAYTLLIQAEDSRGALPDSQRIRLETFNIEVVLDTFINTTSYSFDGVDEYLLIADDPSLDVSTEFTFSAWVKPDNIAGAQYIASRFREAGRRSWGVRINSSGSVAVIYSETGTASDTTTAPNNLDFGVWTHVLVTFSGNDLRTRIYYNGVLEINEATVLTSLKNNDIPMLIGALGDQNVVAKTFYSGLIDEVGIYGAELDQAQVTELYSAGSPTNPATLSSGGNLISAWRMGDNNIALVDPDEIGSNDADLINMNNSNKSSDVPT